MFRLYVVRPGFSEPVPWFDDNRSLTLEQVASLESFIKEYWPAYQPERFKVGKAKAMGAAVV